MAAAAAAAARPQSSGSKRQRVESENDDAASDPLLALAEARELVKHLIEHRVAHSPTESKAAVYKDIKLHGFCPRCCRMTSRCECPGAQGQADTAIAYLGGIANEADRRTVATYLQEEVPYDCMTYAQSYTSHVEADAGRLPLAIRVFIDLLGNDMGFAPVMPILALVWSAGLRFDTNSTGIPLGNGGDTALSHAIRTRSVIAYEWLGMFPAESVDFRCHNDMSPVAFALRRNWNTALFRRLVMRSSTETLNARTDGKSMLEYLLHRILQEERFHHSSTGPIGSVYVLMEAAQDDGSGIDLLSRSDLGLMPHEQLRLAGNELETIAADGSFQRAYHAVCEATERVRTYRSGLVPALYEVLLPSSPSSGPLQGVKDLVHLIGCYIAPRFNELLVAAVGGGQMSLPQQQQPRRPAAAAAAAAAATVECMAD